MSALPLKTPRLVLLGLTWALAVIGAAAGLNAIVKRNDQVATIKSAVAALKITVNVDTNNLLRSGIVLAVGCLLLSITSSIFILLLLLDSKKSSTTSNAPLSTRTLPTQTATLAFLTIWLFATLIAVTKIAAHGSADVHAYSGGIQLPDSLVKATESRLGFSRVYWDQLYVRILTIAPWFAFLSALITTIVTFLASRKRTTTATSQESGWTEREKGETEMTENVRIE
ncbi:hypothetical protein BDV93DRAFT_75884 [Ceratobasidium sp. AG-I]|nr:hypothetical protein BDV93DRAFT_75884 [Ceratobasidium sp. AG-I]